MSTSHFMMELKVVSWMPALSRPIIEGWNSTSGHRKRSLPMVMTCGEQQQLACEGGYEMLREQAKPIAQQQSSTCPRPPLNRRVWRLAFHSAVMPQLPRATCMCVYTTTFTPVRLAVQRSSQAWMSCWKFAAPARSPWPHSPASP